MYVVGATTTSEKDVRALLEAAEVPCTSSYKAQQEVVRNQGNLAAHKAQKTTAHSYHHGVPVT